MSEKDEIEIDLVELIKHCWKKKWFFIIPMAAVAVLVVLFCIISIVLPPEKSPLPNKYTSTAKILVRESSSRSAISSSLSSLASLGGINLSSTGNVTNGTLLITIADTNSYKDSIIDKFNLIEKNKIKSNVKTTSRKILSGSLSVSLDDKTNILSVSFSDIDPVFAEKVASYATDLLIKKFYEIGADDDAINLKNYQEAMDSSFRKIVEYQKDIQNLEQSVSNTAASSVPSIMFDVQMKKMELEAEETIYATYRGQYELLTIQMEDDPTTIKLIQEAEIPEVKSKPSRAKICIIVELIAFILCFGYVFFDYYRQTNNKAVATVKEDAR